MKRIISLLLVFILVLGVLPGCKRNENDTEEEAALVTYEADFAVKGSAAKKLIAALEAVGITYTDGEYEKTIYVGTDENELTLEAMDMVASRENNYNDYSIVCNGVDVAVYAPSTYALDNAIAYFISQYVSEGVITLESDLAYLEQPETSEFTVAGKTLSGMRVVAGDAKYRAIAKNLAKALCISTGYYIVDSAVAGDNDLTVMAKNASNEEGFSENYTVSVKNSKMSITAPTRASLSYAVQHFANSFADNVDFAEGTNEEKRFTMRHVDATDKELFKYCGMWEANDAENPTSMVSYWNVAYVEICFTGNAITPEFSRETTFKIKMDDDLLYSEYYTANGKVTFFADGDGVHTLRIYTDKRSNHLNFAGVSVEENTTLSRAADKAHYIQFVGDSISDTTKSFSHRVGDILGWDHSVTAISGIALEDDYGSWKYNHGYDRSKGDYVKDSMAEMMLENFDITSVGMETAFFKLGVPENSMLGAERENYGNNYYTPSLDCSFTSGNTPDIVFIFLGTNDELNSSDASERFTKSYLNFVGKILKLYGEDTQIIAMNAVSVFSSPSTAEAYCGCIRDAADELAKKYPDNFTFIDRDVIETWGVEIKSAEVESHRTHPTDKGYDTLTTEISAYLRKLFG